MKTHKLMGMLVAVVALAVTSIGAQAAVLFTSLTGGAAVTNYPYEMGNRFTPTKDLLVTQLGFVDLGGDGLASSHTVTVWQVDPPDGTFTSGSSLGSVTVTNGSPLIGDFRYEPLSTPITLTAGTKYVLAADIYAGGDPWYNSIASYTLGLPVTMNGGQWGDFPGSYPYYFGSYPANGDPVMSANLLGEVLVPEPSSVLLLAVGGFLAWRRMRK